jgi:hypothetical protein
MEIVVSREFQDRIMRIVVSLGIRDGEQGAKASYAIIKAADDEAKRLLSELR